MYYHIGGSGKYTNEHKAGLKPIGSIPKKHSTNHHNKGNKHKSRESENDILVYQSTKPHPSTSQLLQDPQKFLDNLRKEQNDLLLKLLDGERRAEDERIQSLRLVGSNDVNERNRLELVFAEERRRASERIILMTKTHEKRLKEVVIQVELGRAANHSNM